MYMPVAMRTPELVDLTIGEVFVADGREFGYGELYGRYESSAMGEHHYDQPLRYAADFGYGTRQEMLADLGPDIHPVTHMEINHRDLSALLLRYLCFDAHSHANPLDLSPNDIIAGRFASLIHDAGENTAPQILERCGVVVGDIPHGKKTPEDRANEKRVFEVVLSELYGDLPVWLLERALAIVTHEEHSQIHQLYEISHDFGVYSTGLVAGNLALHTGREEQTTHRFMQQRSLATEVTVRARSSLEDQVDLFPATSPSLEASQHAYKRMLSGLS
jgi:hypothetical protein